MKIAISFVFISLLFFGAVQSHAVTLQVEGGLLTGATGVDVSGTAYDVMFMDGSCNSLFDNCNPSAFIFNNQASAVIAAQTLLDTVLIDSGGVIFDTTPEAVRGCTTGTQECSILTPYLTNGITVTTVFAVNNSSIDNDLTLPGTPPGIFTNNEIPGGGISVDITYAVWKAPASGPPIPEPATFLMLSTGLLGLASYRWQKRLRERTQQG